MTRQEAVQRELARWIRWRREYAGLSLEHVSERTELPIEVLRSYEEDRGIPMSQLATLMKLYGVRAAILHSKIFEIQRSLGR